MHKPEQNKQLQPVPTPCIGICSTVYGDAVCRGCKRYNHEIIHWNGYNREQKLSVLKRLSELSNQVISHKLALTDLAKLEEQLNVFRVRYLAEQSHYWWAYQLLQKASKQITNLSDCGIEVKPAYQHLSLAELKDMLDEEFYILAEAHYQRYYEPVGCVSSE